MTLSNTLYNIVQREVLFKSKVHTYNAPELSVTGLYGFSSCIGDHQNSPHSSWKFPD